MPLDISFLRLILTLVKISLAFNQKIKIKKVNLTLLNNMSLMII